MHNITLIATAHSENGKCNSDELYKILEYLKPEVIFDELPIHFSEMYYSDSFEMARINNMLLNRPNPEIPLEVKSVKRYMQKYDIKIVPVDIDTRQKLFEHQQDRITMLTAFLKNEDYQKLDQEQETLMASNGFNFLNSTDFLELLEKKAIIEKYTIDSAIEKDRLNNIYKLFQQELDNREIAMLQNIYNYSKDYQFRKAVFLIGAGHKKSIIQKIEEYEKNSEIKLNWIMYNPL